MQPKTHLFICTLKLYIFKQAKWKRCKQHEFGSIGHVSVFSSIFNMILIK